MQFIQRAQVVGKWLVQLAVLIESEDFLSCLVAPRATGPCVNGKRIA